MVTRPKPRVKSQMWSDHRKKLRKPTKRGARPYAPNWHGANGIAVKVRRATKHVCTCCLTKEAKLTHHLQYSWFLGKVYGHEIGGIHCCGVCERCHDWLHTKPNWIYDDNPDRDRNSPEIITRLRLNYWMLYFGLNFWWLILVAIGLFVLLR